MAFGAAVLVVVAAFLPWAQATTGFGTFTKSGIDGDGMVTLLLGAGAGFGIFNGTRRGLITAAVLGAVTAAIGGYDAYDIANSIDGIDVGVGVVLTIIGGLAVLILAALGNRLR